MCEWNESLLTVGLLLVFVQQFFLTSNLTQSKLATDVALPADGNAVVVSLAQQGSMQSRRNGADGFESNFNASCSSPLVGWKLKRIGLPDDSAKRYRIRAENVGERSRFRIGLTPATGPLPGLPFYREWMADSDGCWVAAGVPDLFAEIDGDKFWGSFGQDGWGPTNLIDMDVDLDDGHVEFSGRDATSEKASEQRSTTRKVSPKLRFSLDGFVPLLPQGGGRGAKERREYTTIKESLTINKVHFDFEAANFGPDLPLGQTILAKLVPADPLNACTGKKSGSKQGKYSYRGAIMYAQRGECDFLDKVLYAQAAGAAAIIIGDNVMESYSGGSKKHGSSKNAQPDLIIMDQFGRDQEASKVKIPSVFVSFKAHKHVTEFLNRGKQVSVTLQGPVYTPAHHGVHWRETGLVPSLWLAPGTSVRISLIPFEENKAVGPKSNLGTETLEAKGPAKISTSGVDSGPEGGGEQSSAVCRSIFYVPLALSERKGWSTPSGASTPGSSNVKVAQTISTWSKRLVASGQVCNEDKVAHSMGNFATQPRLVSYILPWASDSSEQISPLVRDLKLE